MAVIAESKRVTLGESARLVGTVVKRDVTDMLRDWRIVVPILILTLLFPSLMTFVANVALDWVAKYGGAPIIGERLVPFMLMVAGFFPISFSLVIALETFVGERERNSLEPLLATPLTDTQLYLGKLLAAMIPPLVASYLGLGVYLVGLYFSKGWLPPPILFAIVILLTTAAGLVMVSGAVVLSSQTTSVRAANLLASFIIIPMTLLVQGEAIVMFWANYHVLWWIVLFLLIVDVILVRMGIRLFNREELLGREIDELNLGSLWHKFYGHFRWKRWFFGRDVERMPRHSRWLGTLAGLYLRDIPAILRRSWLPVLAVVVGLLFTIYIGHEFAARFQLPADALRLENVSAGTFADMPGVDWLPSFTIGGVLFNNVRSLAAGALLAVFSFGTLAIALLMAPLAIIFFFAAQVARLGYNPGLFLATFMLPHGIFELPAGIIATALAVRMGATFMWPPKGVTVGEGWLWALADFVKVFLALVLPLLALAAAVEVHVTPWIVVWAYGG